MKKLLSILAAFGLSASAATSVVACDSGDSASEKLVKEFYKTLKVPTTQEESYDAYDEIELKTEEIFKEILKDIYDGKLPAEAPTQEQLNLTEKHEKIQLLFAHAVALRYYHTYDQIFYDDKEDALEALNDLKDMKTLELPLPEESGLKSNFAPSKANKEGIDKLSKELEEKINAMEGETVDPEVPGPNPEVPGPDPETDGNE